MFRRRRRTTVLGFVIVFTCLYVFLQYFISNSRFVPLTIIEQIHFYDDFYLQPSTCFTKTKNENIRRAILVYFPIEYSSKYMPELKWLYLSWIETIQNQPNHWQTDLLVYSLSSSFLDELGCFQYRKDPSSTKNNCFRIPYRSLWNRTQDSELIRLIQIHIPDWCRHLNSLGILIENEEILNEYDYILRTDIDVFLTPNFANYIPFDCTFQIGLGGYSFDYNTHRLSRIAQTLKLADIHFRDIGSTWYGPPQQIVLVGRLALWLSVWLGQNEFTVVEKNERFAVLSWPQWYIGVISMYASHLAISHYAGRGQIKLIQIPNLLDHSCTTNVSMNEIKVIHIHAWHVRIKFLIVRKFFDICL